MCYTKNVRHTFIVLGARKSQSASSVPLSSFLLSIFTTYVLSGFSIRVYTCVSVSSYTHTPQRLHLCRPVYSEVTIQYKYMVHNGHSTALQTQMDRIHLKAWLTATGHKAREDVGQRNKRRKCTEMLSNITSKDYVTTKRSRRYKQLAEKTVTFSRRREICLHIMVL